MFRLLRAYGIKNVARSLLQDRAGSALLTLLLMGILVMEFGSLEILHIEQDAPGANITTASDALWYNIVTISTVGYGDRYPVTNKGRMVGSLIIIVGVGIFGTFTGYLANLFLAPSKKKAAAAQPPPVNDDAHNSTSVSSKRWSPSNRQPSTRSTTSSSGPTDPEASGRSTVVVEQGVVDGGSALRSGVGTTQWAPRATQRRPSVGKRSPRGTQSRWSVDQGVEGLDPGAHGPRPSAGPDRERDRAPRCCA